MERLEWESESAAPTNGSRTRRGGKEGERRRDSRQREGRFSFAEAAAPKEGRHVWFEPSDRTNVTLVDILRFFYGG